MRTLIMFICIHIFTYTIGKPEDDAASYLHTVNERYAQEMSKIMRAKFHYYSELDPGTFQKFIDTIGSSVGVLVADWKKTRVYNIPKTCNESVKRQFSQFAYIQEFALGPSEYQKYSTLIAKMLEVYANAYFRNKDNVMKKETVEDALEVMETSKNYQLLKYEWTEVRKAIGPNIRQYFIDLQPLENQASELNKFRNLEKMRMETYKPWDVEKVVPKLWKAIRPLYLELHAYIRFHLSKQYKKLNVSNPIPEHFLGYLYAKSWSNLNNNTMPYPERQVATDWNMKLKKKKHASSSVFQVVDEFYVGTGFPSIYPHFPNESVVDKENKTMVCMPSIFNYYGKDNPSLLTCTYANVDSLMKSMELIGLQHYYNAFKHLPPIFQNPANPAVGIALGSTLAISANNLKYLAQMGLSTLKDLADGDYINMLYTSSLNTIAPLPFYLSVEYYRWQFFSGKIAATDLNCKWWKLVNDFQGIEPPMERTEKDFDPGIIPEIVYNQPTLRHFLATILKFQMHKEVCSMIGEYNTKAKGKALHMCYIYGKEGVYRYFRQFMELGNSQPFSNIMQNTVKNVNLDPQALMEYYNPLLEWLIQFNKENNVTVGWTASSVPCTS